MPDHPADHAERERFRREWNRNFAVSANAGSGKTTAISERLAAIALAPDGAEILRRTAVVTYTRKAASQIGQRARQVLLKHLAAAPAPDLTALDHLERAFFGTIHSFCLRLAQTYGQTAGINLNPELVAESDDALWEEFLESDPMTFHALTADELGAFLRHLPLEEVFALARTLDRAAARRLAAAERGPPPRPAMAAYEQLLALTPTRKGAAAESLRRNQERARAWQEAWSGGRDYLPLFTPLGSARAVGELADQWMRPLKTWLATAAGALAAELAERYRAWRFERGVQTYADQIDAALAVLSDDALLDRIRAEGWRIVLDEAQDTDPQQFAVLVEIARPPGARRGEWPAAEGRGAPGPRRGHFCLVGDGQQSIYSSRADIANFLRHVEAFGRGDGGDRLEFSVTFRTPQAVVTALNPTLADAFSDRHAYNCGVPPAPDAPARKLQVDYVPLQAGPNNAVGAIGRIPLTLPTTPPRGVAGWLEEEARQIAQQLAAAGPGLVGAATWGDIVVLAPRNDWLLTARRAFEAARLKVALQTRRSRNGDHPAYAWLAGLLAVCCDPENSFEWVGVLREVFGLPDDLLAAELRRLGKIAWDDPAQHPAELAAAVTTLRPFILQVDEDGRNLAAFARELVASTRLAAKACAIDPAGGLVADLDRLIAAAARRATEGAGPRDWLRDLLDHLEEGRPSGQAEADAINLLTAHSAKGLEWPVVIVLGLWRGIGKAGERGLRLLPGTGPDRTPQVYFDQASVPAETREARDRERWRELVRLLYVTLTRPRYALVVPWVEGFGGAQRESPSFAELWGAAIDAWPAVPVPVAASADVATPAPSPPDEPNAPTPTPPTLPPERSRIARRFLPHQLKGLDLVRQARHEAEPEAVPLVLAEDAVDYGLWWHETLEFLPWTESDVALGAYAESALGRAESAGFAARGREELARFLASAPARALRDPRWTRQAELAVLAPWQGDGWIDGVIDLVLHDPVAGEVWVVDWKTNRRRAGESDAALLARLAEAYTPQLTAYGQALAGFFPGQTVRRWVYSSAVGQWIEVGAQA